MQSLRLSFVSLLTICFLGCSNEVPNRSDIPQKTDVTDTITINDTIFDNSADSYETIDTALDSSEIIDTPVDSSERADTTTDSTADTPSDTNIDTSPDTAVDTNTDTPVDAPCPPGFTECSGGCVNTTTDLLHCGGCYRPCQSEQNCLNSQCIDECTSECILGQRQCASNSNSFRECVDRGGCPAWSEAQACPVNHLCIQDSCVQNQNSCSDECQQGTQQCASQSAGNGQPGSLCNCDADCIFPEGHTAACIHGICMAQGSQNCSFAGSSEECFTGARCWSGTGIPICYPDCSNYQCEGQCDPDGSCVALDGMDCYQNCGTLCGRSGSVSLSQGYIVCGNYDNDPCQEWGDLIPCPQTTTCQTQSNTCEESSIPTGDVEWITHTAINSQTDGSWGSILTDIVQHCPSEWVSIYWDSDKVTHGHETTHGINAHIRNNYNNTGRQANGFYCLNNLAAIVIEPNIRKSNIAAYVPGNLQGSRYSLYILGSPDWDDSPLYIWDEWVAYTNGTAVAIDLVNSGLWHYEWRDACAGTIEFVAYALAVGMAVEALDPGYFSSNEQFHAFMTWQLDRSASLFRQCRLMSDFSWDTQDQYYQNLRTSPDAETMRQFVIRTFGADFASDVLEF